MVVADAVRYVHTAPAHHWDIIIMDIIGVGVAVKELGVNPDRIPAVFRTQEYVAALKSRLKPGGELLWNTFVTDLMDKILTGDPSDSSKEVKELLLAQFANVYTGVYSGNRVFMASDGEHQMQTGRDGLACNAVSELADPVLAATVMEWWAQAAFKDARDAGDGQGGHLADHLAQGGSMRGRFVK